MHMVFVILIKKLCTTFLLLLIRFTAWPTEALERVASMFIAKMEGVEGELRDACVQMCQLFHVSVVQLSDR